MIFGRCRKSGSAENADLTLVFVALITAQGIGKMLAPEDNVFAALAHVLGRLAGRRGVFYEILGSAISEIERPVTIDRNRSRH